MVSSITFLGSAIKAFDKIGRNIVLKETGEKFHCEGLRKRIVSRHKKLIAQTIIEGECLDMVVVNGVAQSDPNGPPTYVNGYAAVLKDIDKQRQEDGNTEMELKMPEW